MGRDPKTRVSSVDLVQVLARDVMWNETGDAARRDRIVSTGRSDCHHGQPLRTCPFALTLK